MQERLRVYKNLVKYYQNEITWYTDRAKDFKGNGNEEKWKDICSQVIKLHAPAIEYYEREIRMIETYLKGTPPPLDTIH